TLFFPSPLRPPPTPPLFPYTTLFRSRAVHLEPAKPQNWYLLGRYWQYNLEDPDAARAIHSYLFALSLNPGSSDTWLDLATVYERSEEHTSELQSLRHLVCRLLLEKKN